MSPTTADSQAHGNTSDHEGSSISEVSNIKALNGEKTYSISPIDPESAPSAAPLASSDNDANIVDFDGPDDPYRPLNWPMRKKLVTTILYSFTTMGATWASTIYNSGISEIQERFGISSEVALLGMTFYLFGNALGPLCFAPLSEAYGRKISVLIPYFMCAIFSFGTAVAKDTQTVLITRFFAGIFASAPLSNVGGVLADIWPPQQRGAALLTYGIAVISGPLVAPIVGGALVVNMEHDGWRWGEYITGILLLVILAADTFFIEESFPPVLLSRKASKLRKLTGNWALHSKHQESDLSFKYWTRTYLLVPLEMLVDPICFLINLYASFVYAIIYLTVPVFPIEFQGVRGWNAVIGSLPFLGVLIGAFFGGLVLMWSQGFYVERMAANNNKPVPEARLLPMMIGSFFFAGGLFIIGWTSDRSIHWIAFCIGGVCIGLAYFTIFQSAISYLVDTYFMLAASALAANMLMRSVLAGAFPLFAHAMFTNLGIDWACSVLGFIAVAMIPIPFLFYTFGKRLRAWGKSLSGYYGSVDRFSSISVHFRVKRM
ncbi:conserved hypothetical protein [Talaromyces stipitatus ATCC 10500]|uniref:Major facilitator superfamily (MFS) profile domain-containing protein n=1 Tax=Talaromyces stipitatus (strain ATCC 10500 / CBS 375.48 / QM 6759 / NRRL 1006) TaxID=441959 RepID=B8MQN6_TALSN|nr:uncharacterized protein TSTA_059450 [Talaromyces stipitatus ATCC 10500]EED13459.1 conserved hypothetical protein [Talaromyces stipitatus ATCC 10500]